MEPAATTARKTRSRCMSSIGRSYSQTEESVANYRLCCCFPDQDDDSHDLARRRRRPAVDDAATEAFMDGSRSHDGRGLDGGVGVRPDPSSWVCAARRADGS